MRLPDLSPPVQRPHFTEPALAVDIRNGRVEDLVQIRMNLLHGANYNDPAAFYPERITQNEAHRENESYSA